MSKWVVGMQKYCLLLLLICPLAVFGEELATTTSVWDGVYTKEQAQQGARLFSQHCLACHSNEIGVVTGHGPAPALLGDDFAFRWLDAAVADLFDTIRQTMPEAAPNSLSAAEYADLTAYLLALNGYPEGRVKLDSANYQQLLETLIDKVKDSELDKE